MEIIMNVLFDKLRDSLNCKINEYENIYGDMLDKVLNENATEIHTMLMKSDFQNYKDMNAVEIAEVQLSENADLSDLNLYEKELAKIGGDQTR